MLGILWPTLTPLTPWQLLQVRARPSMLEAAWAAPKEAKDVAIMASRVTLRILSSKRKRDFHDRNTVSGHSDQDGTNAP
jgi:hypothetical protein